MTHKQKKWLDWKILAGSAVVIGGGIWGYHIWSEHKKKKELDAIMNHPASQDTDSSNTDSSTAKTNKPVKKSAPKVSTPTPVVNSGFPLQKGSSGDLVGQLQHMLTAIYGDKTLPKYGEDKKYGNEVIAALKKNNWPEVVNETTFNLILSKYKQVFQNLGKTMCDVVIADKDVVIGGKKMAVADKFDNIKTLFQKIKNLEEYKIANESFKLKSPHHLPIVSTLLTKFGTDEQKQELGNAFSSIGLQYSDIDKKWHIPSTANVLAGLQEFNVLTVRPGQVWISAEKCIPVNAGIMLGRLVSERQGYTCFENSGKHFLIQTQSVHCL